MQDDSWIIECRRRILYATPLPFSPDLPDLDSALYLERTSTDSCERGETRRDETKEVKPDQRTAVRG